MHRFRTIQHGVSLIELALALSLSTALAGMALPSWTQATLKGRRADAHALSQRLEAAQSSHFSRHRRYAESVADLHPLGVRAESPAGHYHATLRAASASGYELVLSPVPGSPQAQDATCAQFTLRQHRGALTHRAQSASGQDRTAECWPQ